MIPPRTLARPVLALLVARAAGADPGSALSGPAPAVTVGDSLVIGWLDRDKIEEVIATGLDDVARCAADEPLAPVTRRTVVVGFTLDPKGRVVAADPVRSDLVDARANACIVAVVRAMRFPKPSRPGHVLVRVPLYVTPR